MGHLRLLYAVTRLSSASQLSPMPPNHTITLFLLSLLAMSRLSTAVYLPRSTDIASARDHVLQDPPCCFADSCTSWSLDQDGHTIHSTCWDKTDQRGHWAQRSGILDLDECVGNADGSLVPVERYAPLRLSTAS